MAWTSCLMKKGRMKSRVADDGEIRMYLDILIACFDNVASASAYPSPRYRRDVLEIERRTRHEGVSFLTKTMPALAKALDKALATGTPLQCTGFKSRGTQIPEFFRPLFSEVIDDDGRERSDASPRALGWLRDLLYLFYKVEFPTTEKHKDNTINEFIRTDSSLPRISTRLSGRNRDAGEDGGSLEPCRRDGAQSGSSGDAFQRPSITASVREDGQRLPRSGPGWFTSLIVQNLFCTSHNDVSLRGLWRSCSASCTDTPGGECIDPRYTVVGGSEFSSTQLQLARRLIHEVLSTVSPVEGLLPRHGPGAVATGEKGHEKVQFKRYYRRLADVFHYDQHFFYNLTHLSDDLEGLKSLEELDTGTAKVVLVPKDSRGPRLISCEPLEYQWIQQGLLNKLVTAIEEHKLTRGEVNFTSQRINRSLALAGSIEGDMVTLDMKDASDRVSWNLVASLLPDPWRRALWASRSDRTRLPCGREFKLRKFAPMGSAVCFPVEALIFWALSKSAIYLRHNQVQPVYVYGDDIIVHREDHAVVLNTLPAFYLKFNVGKCCTSGSFRESCGCDAFKGVVVTSTKLRQRWISSLPGTHYASWVEFTNALYQKGYTSAVDLLQRRIQKIRRTPFVPKGSGVIGFVDDRKIEQHENRKLGFKTRWGSPSAKHDFQRYEILSWKLCSRPYRAITPGWSEMQRVASEKRWESHPIVRLAPANPAPSLSSGSTPRGGDRPLVVSAYQYTLPRRVTLKRGWQAFDA